MTITTTSSQIQYTGDGASLAFAFPTPFIATTDIKVYLNGVLQASGYSVAGLATIGGSGTFPSGTVPFMVAPAVGVTVLLICDPDQLQSTSIPPNDPFPSKTVEKMIDKLTLLVQRIYGKFGNALKFPVGDTTDGTLPSAAARANTTLTFGPSGEPLATVPAAGTATALSIALLTSAGAAMVGFLQAGVGAVLRTVQAKLREWPSATDFGAVGDGVTNDTAAMTAAQTASPFVYLPQGKTFFVTAGLNYWQFYGPGRVIELGVEWEPNPTPQVGYPLRSYKVRTFGIQENAVAATVSINSTSAQTRANTQVLGTTTQGLAQTYTDRDHVALYAQGYSYEPDVTSAATTYTATTLTDASTVPTLIAGGKLFRGMIIDTKHGTPLTGRIQSWSGSTITVDAWYTRGTGVAATPANGTGAIINPNSKIWAQVSGLFLSGNATNNQAQKGTGYELDLSCDATTTGVGVWGFDAVTTGGKPERHFSSRGSRTYGYYAETGADVGFVANTDVSGFEAQDCTAADFSSRRSGTQRWAVIQGSLAKDYVTLQGLSGSSAIATDVSHVLASGTGQTYTLESPVGKVGRRYKIRALNANTLATAAGLIDGAATKAMVANTSYEVISDNTNWNSF